MIDRDHKLSITRQARLLNISRGSVYYLPQPVSPPISRSCAELTSCTWSTRSWARACCATS